MKAAKSARTSQPQPASPTGKRVLKRRVRRPRRIVGDWAETFPLRDHLPVQQRIAEGIATSSFLSKRPMLGREQKEDVMRLVPEDLTPSLDAAGIDYVLVGAHGLAGWLPQARATEDVDFLVRVQDKQKAADAVLKKYPVLEIEKHPDVWRLKLGDATLVDLMLNRSALYKRMFLEYIEIKAGRRKLKVPKLEAALVMKFASMIGHHRPNRKKLQDAVDFMALVEANTVIHLELLKELSELVYPGGKAEIVKMVEDVRAGRKLEI